MNTKRTIVVTATVLLGIFTGFAIAYSYINARLTANSVRIVRAHDGIFNHAIAPFPEGIEILTDEEFIMAMERETGELTDEEFRQAIERDFNPDTTAAGFGIHDELEEVVLFRGDDAIFEREEISSRIMNFLFIGDDARIDQDRGRSDTVILISYNRDSRIIYLTSFMRDILVPTNLSGSYWGRINIMNAIGGPGRTTNVLNNIFSLDIQRYAAVRFPGVFALVDDLEGLELNLTENEAMMINRIFPDFDAVSAGNNLLNGRQVLAYSRMRVIDNDLVRTQRQRNVLISFLNKVLDTRNIGDIFSIAAFMLEHVETNVPLEELIIIGLELFSGPRPLVRELRIPINGSFNHALYNDAHILTIDFRENITALHEAIYGSADDVDIPELTENQPENLQLLLPEEAQPD